MQHKKKDFDAVLKNSTAQLLQATKPNTTTKLILAQLKQIKKNQP